MEHRSVTAKVGGGENVTRGSTKEFYWNVLYCNCGGGYTDL